jgi:hypothetical protein
MRPAVMPSRLPYILCALVLCAPAGALQPPPEEPPPAEVREPAGTEAETGEAAPEAGTGTEPISDDRTLVPELNVYFPEGELDIRINRLVKKVFAEGQIKYNFVDGDITAFLRYRYYGFARTYQLTVFDEIEFDDIEDFSNDFERVRGILLLTEWPQSFHRRTFLLTELDRISSNKDEFVFDTGKTNLFARLGYQIGTPNDERSNAIVGENRARVEELFTAFRQIGPGDAGVTGALTYGTDVAVGDFDYVKAEFSALKRFELPRGFFLFGRLHGGTFPYKKELDREIGPENDLPETGRYAIPREEFFRLDGRDNLKGLDERLRGTDEIHATWELVFPWFVGQDYKKIGLSWENWYWVIYGGAGTIGFDTDIFTETDEFVYDFGLGWESSFSLRDYEFFFSGLVAQAFNAEGGVQLRLSLKSYH